ncbi:MAG TPA: hypothetical protein VHO01_15165 [Jatrophihabitans sp.]|nr:hypothetical protein [Jatrophihabitans sp.]
MSSVEPPAAGHGPAAHEPAWRRATQGERRWWVAAGSLVAIALQTMLPDRFAIHPQYLLPAVELVALAAIVLSHPERMGQRPPRVRYLGMAFTGLVAAVNFVSLVLLVRQITDGSHIPARQLLIGGGEIWFVNVLAFALWYWETDRGGPGARARGGHRLPDLLFPQLSDPRYAAEWEPEFFDYLFVSYTNATAFSPTDTMPMSRWMKLLFLIQSAVSLASVALIAARAVNILPGGG